MNRTLDQCQSASNPLTAGSRRLPPVVPQEIRQESRNKRSFYEQQDGAAQNGRKRQNLDGRDQYQPDHLTPPRSSFNNHFHSSRSQDRAPFAPVHPTSPNTSDFFEDAIHGSDVRAGNSRSSYEDNEAGQIEELEAIDDALFQDFVHQPAIRTDNHPPSSVVREFDNDSTSLSDFDPTLQFSPAPSMPLTPVQQDNLLLPTYIDINWEQIRQHHLNTRPASTSPLAAEKEEHSAYRRQHGASHNCVLEKVIPEGMTLQANKTCFHFREMLQIKETMYADQPDISFELFARVMHSHGDKAAKKQHFRIRDLFKVRPPYLSAILANHQLFNPADLSSKAFLGEHKIGVKCYCRCRLLADAQAPLGYSLALSEIRPTTWKDISQALNYLGRDDLADRKLCSVE